jgi:hypothetical protein
VVSTLGCRRCARWRDAACLLVAVRLPTRPGVHVRGLPHRGLHDGFVSVPLLERVEPRRRNAREPSPAPTPSRRGRTPTP